MKSPTLQRMRDSHKKDYTRFVIDFFELAFLAEACIPPRPIARTSFWRDLSDKYWYQMSEEERAHLFEWLGRNDNYKKSLETEEDTKLFHARFDPNNQFTVTTEFNGTVNKHRAFKWEERYYTGTRSSIADEYITDIEKINFKENE